MHKDQIYIKKVIALAKESIALGEHPFAAILVKEDKVVGHSADQSIRLYDPTAHAEMYLIREYCQKNKIITLDGYTIYTFVEPCVMCAGAIKWSKISKVVYCVPQSELQKFSGGKQKPNCEGIINSGYRKVEIIGSILLKEGLEVFANYQFELKEEKIKKHAKRSSRE